MFLIPSLMRPGRRVLAPQPAEPRPVQEAEASASHDLPPTGTLTWQVLLVLLCYGAMAATIMAVGYLLA